MNLFINHTATKQNVGNMVTKGERRLGRTIRKLENSIEFSSKETLAKQDEKNYKENAKQTTFLEDAPVQNLHDFITRPKNPEEHH